MAGWCAHARCRMHVSWMLQEWLLPPTMRSTFGGTSWQLTRARIPRQPAMNSYLHACRLTSPASWRSGRGEHQPALAPPAQSQPAVTAGSQGQPASVKAGCCSARGREGWLLLSQGSQCRVGWVRARPGRRVGWDPAGRAGGRLLRSMRTETSSPAGRGTAARPHAWLAAHARARRQARRPRVLARRRHAVARTVARSS